MPIEVSWTRDVRRVGYARRVPRLKRAALWTALTLVAAVAIVFAGGWLLPVSHVSSGAVTTARTPADAYAAVSDVQSYPRWWSDLTRVEMLTPQDGRPRFRQFMGSDPVVVEIVEAAPPRRFVTRIADPDQPFGGTWTIDIAPSAGGTLITVTERGEVYNPAFRFLSRFVFGHEATIRSFLDALERHLAA